MFILDFENQQVDSLDNNDICPNTVDLETENQLSAGKYSQFGMK